VATHSADDGEAEVALDLTAEVERQRLEDGLLVDAPSCQPLVLEEPSDALLELQGKLTVTHPLLDVAPLHPPLLQPHRHRLQVCLKSKHQTMLTIKEVVVMKFLEHESISLGIIYTMLIWGISTTAGQILRKKRHTV
jgi:hypothetical protein